MKRRGIYRLLKSGCAISANRGLGLVIRVETLGLPMWLIPIKKAVSVKPPFFKLTKPTLRFLNAHHILFYIYQCHSSMDGCFVQFGDEDFQLSQNGGVSECI